VLTSVSAGAQDRLVIDHVRHTYHPFNSVLVKSPAGHWQPAPVLPGARTEPGLVIYLFGTSLYYANASRLIDNITALAAKGSPLRWLVLDCAAIGDVDYTAAAALTRVIEHLRKRHIRLAVSAVLGAARAARPLRHQRRPRRRRLLRHPRRGTPGLPRRRRSYRRVKRRT
jgi:MFS superfamily sulfate permease-like transporter